MPYEFFSGVRTLTSNIIIEMGYVEKDSLHFGALVATGVVLFVFILIINLLFSILNKDKEVRRTKKKAIAAAEGAGQ
jgi:phosphate transport system permease protein